jgi:hypothetical protein
LVTALVDTGADLCVHAARIELAGRREPLEVMALGDELLVGRNLLRSFVATLDGPEERLTITSP